MHAPPYYEVHARQILRLLSTLVELLSTISTLLRYAMASVVASIGGRIAVRARASSSSDDPQPVPVRIPRPSRRAMLSVPVSIAIATRAPDAVDASAPGEWGYADSSNGPARWGDILDADGKASYPACGCAACQQSPIDLVRTAAKGNVRVGSLADRLVAPAKPVTLAVSQKHGTPNYVANDQGNDAAVVAPDGVRYTFNSLHFHTPAENTVDGVANAMEMHMVHLSEAGDIAVLGVLFRHADAELPANAEVAKLLRKIDADGGKTKVAVDLGGLYDGGAGFWEWTGSLTTPPCSGNVRWLLQKEVRGVDARQAEAFKKHVGGFPGNARPTQPLNGRAVLSFDPTGV